MTTRNSFLILCVLLSLQLFAQNVRFVPDKSMRIDKERVLQIQKMVEEINTMPLLIDTVYHEIPYILYFDNQGQLRKYFSQHSWESERGRTVAYYDYNRKLVYYEYEGDSNCNDEKEHYYIHNERIVDFSYYYNCGCCEGELDTSSIKPPTINNLFVETIDEWRKGFIHADSLLNSLANGRESQQAEYLVLPATISRKKDSYYQIYDNLQSMPFPVVLIDSVDNPKTYLLRPVYSESVYIAVKNEDKYAVFPLSLRQNYTIERQSIDGVGNDELIARLRQRYNEKIEQGRYRSFEEQSGVIVWDLDTHDCLLNICNNYMRYYCRYNSSGEIIEENIIHNGFNVNLDEKQLSIQKVKNGKLGLTYLYNLNELGFVLDKVKR